MKNTPDSLTSSAAAGSPRRLPGNVLLFSLLERETVTAVTVSDTNWDQLVLTEGSFEALGPALQDLMVHVEMRNTTGNFELRVAIQKKFLDADWSPVSGSLTSADIILGSPSPLSADGYTPSNVFLDRSRLGGLRIRLLLQYRAKSTGGGVVGAKSEVSIAAACRLFCC